MTPFLRKLTKKLFIIATAGAVAVFVMACTCAWMHPARYWYIAILGVGFPFIVLALVFFVFFWWFFKSRWAFVPLVTLVLGWFQVNKLFAFHPFSSFDKKKEANSIRIMQWNVSRLDQMSKNRPGGSFRQKIFDFIAQQDADVLCMEEFLESNNPRLLEENIPYFTGRLHYPYYYFARDHRRWDGVYEHGVVIFSRYPIVDTLRIRYAGPDSLKAAESLIHADIEVNGQRLRIFATHLQSLLFGGDDYGIVRRFVKGEDSGMVHSRGVIKKFRYAYMFRSQQAEIVRREADESPYPEVICGDFNDVPNSFAYFKVKGDRNDAFLKKGFGIGRSFASLSPTLRIDFILPDPALEVLQFKKTVLPYSDHYPLVADLKLPGKD